MNFKTAFYPAILGALLGVTAATAAPVAPLPGAAAVSAEPVQFRGGNWHDHPMMYSGYYEWHQRQWDAIEGRGGFARSNACTRFRSYDPRTHTYRNKNGRRVACR